MKQRVMNNRSQFRRQLLPSLVALMVVLLLLHRTSFGQAKAAAAAKDDAIELTFIQMNDVYEIAPLEAGKVGGLARVAALRAYYRKQNPNTFTILSGDFLSPSPIGTSSYQGKRINGAQMVDVLNALGLDFVTFGNHEFDNGEEPLLERINESRFTWISSNIEQMPGGRDPARPFQKLVDGAAQPFPEYVILEIKNASGDKVRIGILGLCIGSNKPPFVAWSDPYAAARRLVDGMKGKVDFIIAITHLAIDEDRLLARQVPEIRLILGGHEHTNMKVSEGQTLITKADANAKTVYVHRLTYLPVAKAMNITSFLQPIDSSISEDPKTAEIANRWTVRAYEGFQEKGFQPAEVITTLREPLDGRENKMRFGQTNMGTLIAQAMIRASGRVDAAFFNSGSVRIDDELHGTITQFDIIRTLPFGGGIVEAEIRGDMLRRVLDTAVQNTGRGAYPQLANIALRANGWTLGDTLVGDSQWYRCAVSDYLISGREYGLEFFSKEADGIRVMHPGDSSNPLLKDLRLAVIGFLKGHSEK